MASGLEVAGLALGIFPVVISTIDWYKGLITGRDIKVLAESIKNHHQIFLNSVEYLLRSTIPKEQLATLLADFGGQGWRDVALSQDVVTHMGRDADGITALMKDIYNTLLKLQQKLPERDADANVVARAGHVIKCFVRGPNVKASLKLLKTRIDEFRKLTNAVVKLGPARKHTAPHGLEAVQNYASGLHDAIRQNLRCNCENLHPANIRLENWFLPTENVDTFCLKFSFLFADNAECAIHDHWVTAETTPIPGGSAGLQSLLDALASSNLSSDTVPVVVTAQDPSSGVGHPDDLCSVLKSARDPAQPTRRRLGSLSDTSGRCNFDLFSRADAVTTKTSVTFTEFFLQRTSRQSRVHLGLTLAWGVLQISSTNWLEGSWSKDNLLLVMDESNKPLPYISHRFGSARRNSRTSTLAPATTTSTNWIRNHSLFALGVFLLEMCYNQSIEDLATQDEKNQVTGAPGPHTPFLTAMRLSKFVHEEIGLKYARVVESCLDFHAAEVDSGGRIKNFTQFADEVMRKVVVPLKEFADTFNRSLPP